MGEHADLPAMMGVVQDHVGKHGWPRTPGSGPTVAAKLLHSTRGMQRLREHLAAEPGAFFERSACLLLSTAAAIELRRQLETGRGKPQPFPPDVVHVGENRCDIAGATTGRLGAP